METYIIKYENQILGKKEIMTRYYYGTKAGLVRIISVYEWEHLISIEVLNRTNDNVKHRPITKEQLKKYL